MHKALGVFLLVLATRAPAQELSTATFSTGSLDKLACRVVRSAPTAIGTTLVQIEMKNRGESTAEPTVFRCEWKQGNAAATALVARVPFPRVSRIGRAARSQGAELYWLQIATTDPAGLKVAVAEALFSDATPLAKHGVEVGAMKKGQGQLLDQRVPTTSVPLRNARPCVLDVVLRARFSAPRDTEALLVATIPAAGSAEPLFTRLPLALCWHGEMPYYPGATLESVEVVDWSARLVPDPAPAKALFERAYRAWQPAGTGGATLRGRFTARRESVWDKEPTHAEGTFTCDANGVVTVAEAASGAKGAGAREVEAVLEDLFRQPIEKVLRDNVIELVAPGLLAVRGPGWDVSRPAATAGAPGSTPDSCPVHRVDDEGRFAASGTFERPDGELWRTRPEAGGYLVWGRHDASGLVTTEFEHRRIADLSVPVLRRHIARDAQGKVLIREECRLSDIAVGESAGAAAAPAAPPAGDGAVALRALWERIYRYPDTPSELTARFQVTTPGTDMVWAGMRKVEGVLELHGFAGFRWDRTGWSGARVVSTGRIGEETQAVLRSALVDRLVMWAGRDPCAFPAFDALFRGATIRTVEARGAFEIDSGPVREVRCEGGAIRSLHMRSGLVRRFTWKELGKQLVPEKIETGEETITARWQEVGKGVLLPVDIEFRRVFGREWGPESLKLTAVRLLP